MKRLRIIAAVWLTALFLIFLPIKTSAAPDIDMEAEVGYDGTYLLGSWTPVRIVLKNKGSDLEGSLEITVNAGTEGRMIYSTPVSLPDGSEKEYTIYARIYKAERNLNISLTDGKGKILKSIKAESLNPVGDNRYMLGLVTDDQPSLGYWKGKLTGSQLFSGYQPVSLDAASFPDHRDVLAAFSVLILNNFDTSALRPEQADALNAWLQNGGVLIIGTGLNGKRTLDGLSGSILPFAAGDIKEFASVNLLEEFTEQQISSQAPLQIMDIDVQDGKVLLGNEEDSLVWMFQKGKGTVFVSAFDLGTEPMLSWAGNRMLWEKLLSENLDPDTASYLRNPIEKGQMRASLADVLGNIEAMEMPSVMLILFLFLFYLALAGPLNYIFLKKIDKREWAWVTIPALSIIFAALIFFLGYNTKGGELIVNTISLVDMNANEEEGNLTNYVGIFIPRRGDYEVEIDRYELLSPGGIQLQGQQSGLPAGLLAKMEQANPSRILFDNANIWTMKTFETGTIPVELGSIDSNLYFENGKVKGMVANNTMYPLEDMVIYAPFAFVNVGNIASGEVKNIELTLPVAGRSRYQDNIYNMIDTVFPWPQGTAKDQQSRQDMNRRYILNNLIWPVYETAYPSMPRVQGSAGSQNPLSLKISYFAFYEGQPETGITINGRKPDRTLSEGIILGTMDLTIEREGMVSIPPGMFFAEFERNLSSNTEIGGDYFYIHQSPGHAVFSVDLSPYIHLHDLKIMIGTDLYFGYGKVLIYDVKTGDYAEIQGNTISLDESNLSQYLDQDNKIYLKIVPAGQDQYVEMGIPAVSLEGRVP
jgi:hypothetical protein